MYSENYQRNEYCEDFKIRDFVKENAKEWGLFDTLKITLKQMNDKLGYEAIFKNNDVGHLSEYLALALIDYWDGNIESASRTAEGIKMYINGEREVK